MRHWLFKLGFVLLSALALPAQAQDISPSLKKMLGSLPIAEVKDEMAQLVGSLKKTSCGGGFTGCYATQSGPLHLYFFTSSNAQQTFLLAIDKKMALPHLLKDNVQKVFGDTSLAAPIISISTSDFTLETARMPADLQRIVRDNYFNVGSLTFASGVQLAARATLGGAIRTTMAALGVQADQLTLRSAVVMPIPTDLASGAGSGAGLADAMAHEQTMKKAGADALKPEAFVEFQFAPNAVLPLINPPMNLSDATFFINNALTFGYKGNAAFKGVGNKKILLHFQTPLTPAGVMDLADFSFHMATPPNLTMEDAAQLMVAMASPDPRLAPFGGGFIRNIESLKKPLFTVLKPLSVFQLRNPTPAPEYRFGDPSKPWPGDLKYFNVALSGPFEKDGPYMHVGGEVTVLGQRMGLLNATAGLSGMHAMAVEDLSLKIGPLGRVTLQKMVAQADVDQNTQYIRLKGSFRAQVVQTVEVILSGSTLTINVPASCTNPFEIKATLDIQPSSNIADIFNAQAGASVDPAKLPNCAGQALEAAYNKIANEYKSLGGYSAAEAGKALKKIQDDAAAAAAAQYKAAKDEARKLAGSSTSAAKKMFDGAANQVDNALGSLFGKKKKDNDADDIFDPSVFNWDFYYDTRGTAWGKTDLFEHWRNHGFAAGEQGSQEFHMATYRKLNPDLHGVDKDVLNHWLGTGINEGRQASSTFSIKSYQRRYISEFRGWSYRDVFTHWMQRGRDIEHRNGTP
ncbi:MAG: hypothetical protein RLZ63_931 [Pseudomonadota bacterium]|jgi:hypothetical protein